MRVGLEWIEGRDEYCSRHPFCMYCRADGHPSGNNDTQAGEFTHLELFFKPILWHILKSILALNFPKNGAYTEFL